MMKKDSKIYIAGHRGLIGTAVTQRLRDKGYTNLVYRTHEELDLTRQDAVETFFTLEKPEYVIMNAAMPANSVNVRVNPVGVMLDNIAMIQNVFSAAASSHVQKMLYVCSIACYPSDAAKETLPDGKSILHESEMQPGKIEKVTERYYAMPKLLGKELCQVFNDSGKMRCVTVVVPHAYGTHYHYDDPSRLPVYPALIKRFCDACKQNLPEVEIWGTGLLHREFTYVDDLADGYLLLLEREDACGIYNIGSGKFVSIKETAQAIKAVTGYQGEIVFDTTKPDAVEFPMLCTDRLCALGWSPKVEFIDGVKRSCDYYRKNYG